MAPQVASQARRRSSTQRRPRPRRDLKALEQRRLQAADLFRRSVIPAEIARRLGVSHQVVSEWRKVWAARWPRCVARFGTCRAARQAEPGATGQSRKSAVQGRRGQRLCDGCVDAAARGRGDRATHGRGLPPRLCLVPVAQAIGLELATTGSQGRGARRCGHRAVGRATLATSEKIARRQHALIVFEDESGVSLLPSVRATWAPRGRTPVLRHRFNWKLLSLAGALAYEADGIDAHLVFELRPGAYNDESLIAFLSELNDIERRPVILIWDGLPAHRSRRMTDWVQ